jgi:hypothetical protein
VAFQSGPGAKDTEAPTKTTAEAEVGLPEDIGLSPMADQDVEVIEDATVVVDTKCPGCGHKGSLPEKFVGKKLKCPKCAKLFTVVDSSKAAAPAKKLPGSKHGVTKKPAEPSVKPVAKKPSHHGTAKPAPTAPGKKPAVPVSRPAPPQPAAVVEEDNPFANLTGDKPPSRKPATGRQSPPPEEENPFANLTDNPKPPRRER